MASHVRIFWFFLGLILGCNFVLGNRYSSSGYKKYRKTNKNARKTKIFQSVSNINKRTAAAYRTRLGTRSLQSRNQNNPPAIQKQAFGHNCPEHCPLDQKSELCTNHFANPGGDTCNYGVSLIWDQCGCECKICAAQLNEKCDGMKPCDDVKDLYCDQKTSTCKNLPGRPCVVGGVTYSSGEKFQPSCHLNCTCLNGDIGCMPACEIDLKRTPPTCQPGYRVKRVRNKSSGCCDEYKCISERELYSSDPNYHNNKKREKSYTIVAAAAMRPETIELIHRQEDGCIMQTTSWSECSKSCGIGVSERISNDNVECELKREVRICQVKPCKKELLPKNINYKYCSKPVKSKKTIRLSFNGCLSEKTFKPKFCPNCQDGLCCIPKDSETRSFKMKCSDSDETITKNYMWINSCECNRSFCENSDNNLFDFFRNMGTDTEGFK